MCGFIGFAGRTPPVNLGSGAEWIRRRGPDSMGLWSAAVGHVQLRHARLSISDLRPVAAQPMSDAASGLTVAFVGEIYNHRELRQSLTGPFRTESDTETLLHLFARHGTAALPQLRGMFAIVLFDERRRRIMLMRDPVGKKPLFVLQRPEGAYFGSSVLALAAASGHTELADDIADRWWELGYTPPDGSLLRGCRPLAPGEVLELDWDGSVQSHQRLAPPERRPEPAIDFHDAVTELEGLVRTAVERRLSDNPSPVALLSGGIDSTVVCKFALETGATRLLMVETRPFKTADSRYGRLAARRFGVPLEIVPQRLSNVRRAVETAVDLQDEPLALISFVALAHVAAEACTGSRVLLTGDGGDEVFGGYGRPDDWIAKTPPQKAALQSGPPYPDWMSDYGRRAAGFDLVGHGFAKLDRATAEQAIEARCPLLDWDVQAFVRSLPKQIFFPDDRSKPLAKALLKGWPDSFLERKKAGFPFRLRLLWGLSGYAGLRESVSMESVSRFAALIPPELRKPPQQWSSVAIARNFAHAFKLYVWSVFLTKLNSIVHVDQQNDVPVSPQVPACGAPYRILPRAQYLLWSAAKAIVGGDRTCPSCGGTEFSCVDRKYGVTTLERCRRCKLLFRLPRGNELKPYIEGRYAGGMATDMPDRQTLEQLKHISFKGTEKDASSALDLLSALGCEPGATRVLDYGCSWGYTAWQLQNAGYRAIGFEPDRLRCDYALTRMGVTAFHSEGLLPNSVDVFYSSHVLEHVPNASHTIELARRLVRPGGWIVLRTPNGSLARQHLDGKAWSASWGALHPNLLDDVFYTTIANGNPLLLATDPYDLNAIRQWARRRNDSAIIGDLVGGELLAVMAS